jgi:hypothetical protein
MCDLKYCIFTCFWHTLWNQIDSSGGNQQLNACTECDEKRCGPHFLSCAGANRRRSGILSNVCATSFCEDFFIVCTIGRLTCAVDFRSSVIRNEKFVVT